MSILRKRSPNQRRSHGKYSGRNGRPNASLVSALKEDDTLTLTFDRSVAVNAIPTLTLSPNTDGVEPLSVSQPNEKSCAIVFDGALSATSLDLADSDPAMRTNTGGFVIAKPFPVTS